MTSSRRGGWVVAASALALGVTGWTRVSAQAQPPPTVKTTHAKRVVSIEGKDTFAAYCTACHGATGKGNGPAAPALKMPVPDLTTLAKRHGKFDPLDVERSITGVDRRPAAHGDLTMPIWGPIFKATAADSEATAKLRAANVVDYLKSIQEP